LLSNKVCPSWVQKGLTWTSSDTEGADVEARCSGITTDSYRDNNGKLLGWMKGAGQRPKLLYPCNAEQNVLHLHWAGIQERHSPWVGG